ncbi:MAG: hypothetical protein IPM29_32515 [Planctomycetes bacterium]|nr:hypothetical protein [Planctomycetota bacterium]
MGERAFPHEAVAEPASELQRLATAFESSAASLCTSGAGELAVAEVREHMATAGRLLIRLIGHGAVDAPEPAPFWLSCSLRRYGRRPYFDRVDTFVGRHWQQYRCSPEMSISQLIAAIDVYRLAADKRPRRPREHEPDAFRHRHVFLEAVSGWLGRRFACNTRLRTPVVYAYMHVPVGPPGPPQTLCFDWADRSLATTVMYFADVGRACAHVCRRLAMDLRAGGPNARWTAPSPEPAQQGHSASASWPPPEHPTVHWTVLSPIAREQLKVFVDTGPGAVLEVARLAEKSRGRETPNQHDKKAAQELQRLGLAEKVGRTGRRLIAIPRGMPWGTSG